MGLYSDTKQKMLDDAFFRACRKGKIKKAIKLLDRGANINSTHRVVISDKGYDNIIDVDIAYPKMQTPLHAAVLNRHYKVVKLLIEKGANIDVASKEGLTPLHYASAMGLTPVVESLVFAGANVEMVSDDGLRAEDFARNGGFYNLEEFFLKMRIVKEEKQQKQAELRDSIKEGWHLNKNDSSEVIHVSNNGAGYCLTEIFNFSSRKHIVITRNLATNAETQNSTFFDDFKDKAALNKAMDKLQQLGVY